MSQYEIQPGYLAHPYPEDTLLGAAIATADHQDDFGQRFGAAAQYVETSRRLDHLQPSDPYFELKKLLVILDEVDIESHLVQVMLIDPIQIIQDERYLTIRIYENLVFVASVQYQVFIYSVEEALEMDRALTETQMMAALPVQAGFHQANFEPVITQLTTDDQEFKRGDYHIDDKAILREVIRALCQERLHILDEHKSYHTRIVFEQQTHETEAIAARIATQELDMTLIPDDDTRKFDVVLPDNRPDLSYDFEFTGFGSGFEEDPITQPSRPEQITGFEGDGTISA